MNAKKLSLAFIPMLLVGCNQSSGNNKGKTEYDIVSINFNNFIFEGNTKEISTSSTVGLFESTMSNYIATSTQDSELLSSFSPISYSGLKKIEFDENTGVENFNTLQIGSSSTDGTVTFKFSKVISAISVNAQAYFKVFRDTWTTPEEPYNCYSVDLDTTIKINNETWTLPEVQINEDGDGFSYTMPEREEKLFEINSDTITITDDENLGRFFIHALELVIEK